MEIVAKSRAEKGLSRYKSAIFSLAQHRATVEAVSWLS